MKLWAYGDTQAEGLAILALALVTGLLVILNLGPAA